MGHPLRGERVAERQLREPRGTGRSAAESRDMGYTRMYGQYANECTFKIEWMSRSRVLAP